MRYWVAGFSLFAGLAGAIGDAPAKVVQFEIVRIDPAFEGRSFGSIGTTTVSSRARPWRWRQTTRTTP
jgi:hypothetical protein